MFKIGDRVYIVDEGSYVLNENERNGVVRGCGGGYHGNRYDVQIDDYAIDEHDTLSFAPEQLIHENKEEEFHNAN